MENSVAGLKAKCQVWSQMERVSCMQMTTSDMSNDQIQPQKNSNFYLDCSNILRVSLPPLHMLQYVDDTESLPAIILSLGLLNECLRRLLAY